jgi:hypothetical protein
MAQIMYFEWEFADIIVIHCSLRLQYLNGEDDNILTETCSSSCQLTLPNAFLVIYKESVCVYRKMK